MDNTQKLRDLIAQLSALADEMDGGRDDDSDDNDDMPGESDDKALRKAAAAQSLKKMMG